MRRIHRAPTAAEAAAFPGRFVAVCDGDRIKHFDTWGDGVVFAGRVSGFDPKRAERPRAASAESQG